MTPPTEAKNVLADSYEFEQKDCPHAIDWLDYRKPLDVNLTMQCQKCGKVFE
ncbi:hypothetical protein [Pedobacter sp. MW01-1-1]|uniref:hypothetical protein n=1 Tax=Pedobacter sp. MW01-1-1 TaxID=3383027 RepID=UPI003FEE25B4